MATNGKNNKASRRRSVFFILKDKIKKTVSRVFKRKRKVDSRTTVIIGIISAVALTLIILLVISMISGSESRMKGELEKYANDVYEQGRVGSDSDSYTLNLKYLERNGYDVSLFENKKCDKSATFVVINVDRNGNIVSIVPELSCGVNKDK